MQVSRDLNVLNEDLIKQKFELMLKSENYEG